MLHVEKARVTNVVALLSKEPDQADQGRGKASRATAACLSFSLFCAFANHQRTSFLVGAESTGTGNLFVSSASL